jgi:hypothetical protein
MPRYTEQVEAVQFKKGHSTVMECIRLATCAGYNNDWILSADTFKFGCSEYDHYAHYVSPGEWLVLRADNSIQIVKDEEFGKRYRAVAEAAP